MDDYQNQYDNEFDEPVAKPSTVHEALAAIQVSTDDDVTLPASVIYRLANLEGEDLAIFKAAWHEIDSAKRQWTIHLLAEISENDYLLSFDDVAQIALADSDDRVRVEALELLWHDMSESFFHQLMSMAKDDNPIVRAAVMVTLGRFIQAGELNEFNSDLSKEAEKLALNFYRDFNEDHEVRRRALEGISHSSNPAVSDMIREAYYADDVTMQISAVFAMGSSFDEQWQEIVLNELDSEIPEMRFEAIRAAGQLEMAEAVPHLADAAFDEDYEIQLMAVWSLGEIGTNEAQRVLKNIVEVATETDDDELLISAEEALENAMLMRNAIFPMFNLGGDLDLDELEDYDDGIYLN